MDPEPGMAVIRDPVETPPPAMVSRKRVRAEQHDLALAWMTAALSGALTITFVPERLGPWRMLSPLGAMAAYLLFAFTRSQHSTPRVADSAYFMGFLWTLWALINVLVWHPLLKATELYVAFGYALITTASGMFIRLTLLQFYRTVEDQEEQALDRIDEGVDRLVTELELSQRAAASLRATGARALQDWHKQFVAASDQVVADVKQMANTFTTEGQALTTSIKTVQQSVTATGRHLTTFEKRLGTSTERIGSEIEKSAESLESSVNALVKRLNDIEVPPDLIRGKVDEVLSSVHKAVEPIADLAIKTLTDLKKAIDDVAKAIVDLPKNEQLQNGVANLINRLNLVSQACDRLTNEADATRKALSSIGTGAATILSELAGVEQKIADVQVRLGSVRGAVDTVGCDVQKVDTTVKDVVRFVQSTLGQRR